MSEATILLHIADGVATITLNRPEKLNAFTEQMHKDLVHALDRVNLDLRIKAVLITGSGRAFCAGQDLTDPVPLNEPGAPDPGDLLERYYNPLIRRLQALERPVICAVNGVAAGAGASLALACDLVLAARSASFLLSFAKVGLVPDAGLTYVLPRLVGHARALGMALLSEPVSADQAVAWGMIWQTVDDADLTECATQIARHLAKQPIKALGLAKRAFEASARHTLEQQLDLEAALQRQAAATEDFKEGVAAFLERRPGVFKGR